MAAVFGIEGSERRNPAPAEGKVCRVGVFEARSGRAKIEGGGRPYTVFEGAVGALIPFKKGLEVFGIVVVKPGRPVGEGS